jgi:hypothetical protein
MDRRKLLAHGLAFIRARVMAPDAALYLVFTTFFGFIFVVADQMKSELRQSKTIVVDLAREGD